MARRPGRLPAVCGALALLGGLTACGPSSEESAERAPARPSPVVLDAAGAPSDVAVGVVVSLSSRPGEGAEWSEAAEGAQVAAYRFSQGDTSVTVHPLDDKGTARGAAAAVRRLADDGVSGIVLATDGSHVRAAVAAAAEAGVPVLLPYATDARNLPDNAWLTGPDAHTVDATLAEALRSDGLSRPVVVDAGGGKPAGIRAVASYRLPAGADASGLAAAIARRAASGRHVDSVVVSGPAAQQAAVVTALQGASGDLPVFLTPDALSPAFATALVGSDGVLAGSLTTVGPDAGDVAAMGSGEDGRALSAYFAGLRATAGDDEVTDYFDGQPFAAVAGAADTRSHDAVVSLVVAAAEADSADPADVLEALHDLELGHDDGLAGPDLDFATPTALAPGAVTALQASTQDPGLRPVDTPRGPRLFWFSTPQA